MVCIGVVLQMQGTLAERVFEIGAVGNNKNMVLKIVISKTDYTPSQLDDIGRVMAEKGDLFVDSGERQTFEVSFGGRSAMSKLSQTKRSIQKIVRTGSWHD